MPEYNFTIGEYPAKINPKIRILTGQKFGRLLVIGYAGIINQRTYWHCLCICNNGCTVLSNNLTRNLIKSCGCWNIELIKERSITHGESTGGYISPEYKAYRAAKNRCENPQCADFSEYGGRGIEFRLMSVEQLLEEIGRRPTVRHSLDRINVNGHYEIGNLRWATPRQQAQNKRNNVLLTAFEKTQCVYEWAREVNLLPQNIVSRLKCGWCIPCSLTIPIRQGVCPHKP